MTIARPSTPDVNSGLVVDILSEADCCLLYIHFKSYGEIINYCLKHEIPLTRGQRTAMLAYQWSGEHPLIRLIN